MKSKPILMQHSSTIFLRLALIGFAAIVLGLCIFALPVGIRTDTVGYYRPILFGLYVPAIPFFVALYQAKKLLDCIDKNRAFSTVSVGALKNIKYCGLAICGLFVLGMPYVFHVADMDDAPGVALIGFIIIGLSAIIAVFAGVLQKLLQNAMDIQSENELTV